MFPILTPARFNTKNLIKINMKKNRIFLNEVLKKVAPPRNIKRLYLKDVDNTSVGVLSFTARI